MRHILFPPVPPSRPPGFNLFALPCLQKEANQLVEEFMLLANMTAARMVADAFPDRSVSPLM